MKFRIIYIAVLTLLMLNACENDPFFFESDARLRMEGPEVWTLGTDSLEFSFANYSSTIVDTTFDVTVYVMGEASEVDRIAEFELDADLTTAFSEMYSFPTSIVIPAGSYSATLPVTVNRTSELTSYGVRMYIQVKGNSDFGVGVNEQNHLVIIWSDILSKPNNWDDLVEFFGSYSLTKYRFIIDTLNVSTFDTETLSWAQMKNYQIQLAEALRVYNETHPNDPLTDENGDLVEF